MKDTEGHQPTAVAAWLRILHGDSPGHLSIVSTDDWAGRTFPTTQLDDAAAYVDQLNDAGREGIYARITTLTTPPAAGKRAGAADSAALPALWADLDLAGPGHVEQDLPPDEQAGRAVIAATGLPEPTLWVHSGGGLYPIWLLDAPHAVTADNLDQAKRLAKDWQAVIEHAAASLGYRYGRGVGDLARVLRIPGTINRKAGQARPCRIILDPPPPGTRYTYTQLVDALDTAVAQIAPPETVPAATATIGAATNTGQRATDLSPGDDYAARTTWPTILEAAGWREHYRADDATYWTRPGKTTGTSASTNALGTDRLHVFTTSAPPFEANESYSKFGAYALLRHGGDHAAAARELAQQGYGAPLPSPAAWFDEAFRAIDENYGTEQAEVISGKGHAGDSPRPPATRTWDDIGNADRLTDRFADRMRFAIEAERWAIYDGTHWAFEGAPTIILGLVREMLDDLGHNEAYEYDDTPRVDDQGKKKPSVREDFFKFVGRQRIHARMVAATALARTVKSVQARMTDFDADPYLLNCSNGVINLRTGHLGKHSPELMLSSIAGATYDPLAQAPQWERFLDQVMPDPEVRAYLARIVGYTLTGSTAEQVLFLHHGTGANGKSVFMQVIQALMGGYSQAVPQGSLLLKHGQQGGVPNDIARMVGKRLLITSETGAGRRLDDEMVKQLTGGEQVSARFMRGEFFDFTPIGKIHILTNHLPNVGGGDGMARRLQDIGWEVTIPPERRDGHLAKRIIGDELPGVLAWAVRGCIEWLRDGLNTPEAVRKKTAEHLYQADPIAQWAEERTASDSLDYMVDTHELYVDYREWIEQRGTRAMSEKAFVQVLDERKWERGKDPATRRSVVFGYRLMPRPMYFGGVRAAS